MIIDIFGLRIYEAMNINKNMIYKPRFFLKFVIYGWQE